MSELAHLARRFASSLRGRGPAPEGEAALLSLLGDRERDLYQDQSLQDRAHSVRCADYVIAEVGTDDRDLIVASALHDVGKSAAALGTMGRVMATVVARLVGAGRLRAWADRSDGARARIGRYADHDRRGAELLEQAGSVPLVVAWAREHHWAASDTSIDHDTFWLLRRADHA